MPTFKMALAVSILIFWYASPAKAAQVPLPVLYGNNEKIAKVADFPDTDAFIVSDGTYFDAGVKYTTFEILSVPLYDYDREWAGYIGRDDTYIAVSSTRIFRLAESAGIKLSETPPLPFWDALGGKLVVASLILAFFYFVSLSGKADGASEV